MRTLATKLALDQRSVRLGRRGLTVFLVLCGVWLVANAALLIRGPVDSFTLAPVFGVSGMLFLAVADILREPASTLAVLLRLAGGLAFFAGISSVAVGVYLSVGAFRAAVFAGFAVLAILVAFYLQQKPGGP